MAAIMEIKNSENFQKIADNAASSGSLLVVHFWANWASQCQQMNDVITELSKNSNYSSCTFAKLEAESVPEISMQYGVTSVPTILIFRNKEVIDRVDGANASELTKKVESHSKSLSNVPANNRQSKDDASNLTGRLKKLINSDPVMLFMKGSPDNARCGFSRQIIEILGKYQAKYSSFDIFSDEEVRQGLKTYSNWPTFPQLYINGELIGGLDIVREMDSSGELEPMLPKSTTSNLNPEERLKALINKSPLMIFIKGDRETPRCGFSKTLIGILNKTNLPYETFDILSDEDVRQGLKAFSQWPTYPQIYVKGEFIGGLDIVKEIEESGELIKTLKGEA